MIKSIKIFGFLLLMAGIALFVIPLAGFSINGAVIGISESINQNYFLLAGIVFLMVSIMIITSKSGIQAIVVPTGNNQSNKRRARKASKTYQEIPEDEKPCLLITGNISRDILGKIKPDAEVRTIYTVLREAGIKPSQMKLAPGSNTLENLMYTAERCKKDGIGEIGVVTNYEHWKRVELLEREAKKQGFLDKSFKITPIYTNSTLYDKFYGVAAYIKDFIKIRRNNPFKK